MDPRDVAAELHVKMPSVVKAMAELKNEAEKAISAKDAEISALKTEIDELKTCAERAAEKVAELEAKMASLVAVKKREWEAAVLEPEILPEPPPTTAREVFRPGRAQTLADLERQAQAELARMGAEGAKRFFGLKK